MSILQTATPNPSESLVSGDIFQFVIETFSSSVPIPIVALLVFGSMGVSIYMVTRSMAIPVILFLLIGGVTITQVPLGVQQGLTAALVLAIAIIGYVLLQRVNVS
jgi:hypothetical protein